MKRTRTPLLSVLVATIAALAPAGTAHANAQASCTFQGTANTNPPVQLVGGGGTYGFGSLTFVCVSVEGSNTAVVELDIASTGTYQSGVCGTGTVTSTNNSVNGVSVLAGTSNIDWGAVASNLDYDIEFTGSLGTLTWRDASGEETPGGVVEITANSPPGGLDCGSSFQVAGTGVLVVRTPECENDPKAPVKALEAGQKVIKGSSDTFCDGAAGVAGCARLEKWDDVKKQWDRVRGTVDCQMALGDKSPPATARTACESGRYRTVGEGGAVYVDSGKLVDRKPTAKKSAPVDIGCKL